MVGIHHMDNQLTELSAEERYRKRQLLVRTLVETKDFVAKKVRDKKGSRRRKDEGTKILPE